MQAHPEGSGSCWDHPNLWKRESCVKSRENFLIPKKSKETWGKSGIGGTFWGRGGTSRPLLRQLPALSRNNGDNKENKENKENNQGSLALLRRVPLIPGAGAQGKACPGSASRGLGRGGRCHSVTFRCFPGNGNVQPGISAGSWLFFFLFSGCIP